MKLKQLINNGKALVFIVATIFSIVSLTQAAPLTKAKVTELKNIVFYKPANGNERPALRNDFVKGADVVRTGERSLAELEFDDQSITRLGSQSVFSFKADTREFQVNEGLVLISMPKGKGGGRIVTSAITAAIEGTTVIAEDIKSLSNVKNGLPRKAAKIIFLEGHGKLILNDGSQSVPIFAGQMIIQFKDDPKLAEIQEVDLETIVKNSAILNGFSKPLPLKSAIESAVNVQHALFKKGVLEPNGVTIGGRGGTVHQISQIDLPEIDEPRWVAPESTEGKAVEIMESNPCPLCDDDNGNNDDEIDPDPDVDPEHNPNSDPDVKPN